MSLEAVVVFEYTAEQPDELSLKVGDVITNVQTEEGGWWEGELRGKKGMFPDSYVKLVGQQDPASTKKEHKLEISEQKSVQELAAKPKDSNPVGKTVKKKEKSKQCKALFEYKKENDDELDLAVGDVIDFHREVEDGWWEGSMNGRCGLFPSNFVEMVEGLSEQENIPPLSSEMNKSTTATQVRDLDPHPAKDKKVIGVGLGSTFDAGQITLGTAGNTGAKTEDASKSSKQEDTQSAQEVTMRKKSKSTERAVVRFSYTAEQPDELSLVEGQIVLIIDRNLEDDGWWKGEINGKVGVFPDNFVELLPDGEDAKPNNPPPSALPGKETALSKLPDKALASNALDKPVKPEAKVSIPSKKPQVLPPVVSKKPSIPKPSEPKFEPSIPSQPASSAKDKVLIKENHEEKQNSFGGAHLDNIGPTSQKLTHLTYGRAKGPNHRPPSTVLVLKEEEKEKPIDDVKRSHVPASEKQHSHLPDRQSNVPDRPEKPALVPQSEKQHFHLPDRQSNVPDRPEKPALVPQSDKQHSHLPDRSEKPALVPQSEKQHFHLPDRRSFVPDRPEKPALVPQSEKQHSHLPDRPEKPATIQLQKDNSMSKATSEVNPQLAPTGMSQNRKSAVLPPRPPQPVIAASPQPVSTSSTQINFQLVEQLQRELAELRATMVSRHTFNELQAKHQKLKSEYENLKRNHTVKIRTLLDEVDEEKKLRLTTQVEIDRIKKFLSQSNL